LNPKSHRFKTHIQFIKFNRYIISKIHHAIVLNTRFIIYNMQSSISVKFKR